MKKLFQIIFISLLAIITICFLKLNQIQHETLNLKKEKAELETYQATTPLLNYQIYDRQNQQKLPTFDKLFGMEKEKQQLLEIKEFLKNPTQAQTFGLEPPTGVILYGVPGVGKTVLVQALAKTTELPLIMVNGSDFVSKYKGDSTQKVKELFNKARQLAPSIIFIDECEMALNDLANVESDAEINNTVNAFKEELTSLKNDVKKPIFFVGATNYIDRIDDAIKSRIGNLIEVETLKLTARVQFLNFLATTKFTKIDSTGKKYLTILAQILEAKPNLQSQRQILKILEKSAFIAFKAQAPTITADHLKAGLLNFISTTEYQQIITERNIKE